MIKKVLDVAEDMIGKSGINPSLLSGLIMGSLIGLIAAVSIHIGTGMMLAMLVAVSTTLGAGLIPDNHFGIGVGLGVGLGAGLGSGPVYGMVIGVYCSIVAASMAMIKYAIKNVWCLLKND